MARKKRNPDPGPVTIDLTPLIDCVFLLIAFFVVAGKFKKEETRLDAFLPKDIGMDSASEPDPDKYFIQVLCLGNQDEIKWKVNDKVVETRSELVQKLYEFQDSIKVEGKALNKKDIKVAIDGHADVNFYWVIASLDACAETGLTEIIFAPPRVPLTQWPNPKPDVLKKIGIK